MTQTLEKSPVTTEMTNRWTMGGQNGHSEIPVGRNAVLPTKSVVDATIFEIRKTGIGKVAPYRSLARRMNEAGQAVNAQDGPIEIPIFSEEAPVPTGELSTSSTQKQLGNRIHALRISLRQTDPTTNEWKHLQAEKKYASYLAREKNQEGRVNNQMEREKKLREKKKPLKRKKGR